MRKLLALGLTSALVLGCGSTGTTSGSDATAPGTGSTATDTGGTSAGGSTTSGSTTSGGATSGATSGGSTSGDTTGVGASTGGTTGGTSTLVTGIALPQEVSALPPKEQSTSGATALRSTLLRMRSFLGLGNALVASALPSDSDYATTATVKWVNEQALSKFDVLNSIFKSIGATHYADAENVNAGPYAALVPPVSGSAKDESDKSKMLETWVVSSVMTKDPSGQDVNVLQVWISEGGGVIPVEMRIYAPPVQNADGSYANYGVWSINAGLGGNDSSADFFIATAEVADDGGSLVKVHNTEGHDGGAAREIRGILHKSGTAGYGKVSFPDESQCMSDACSPPTVTVAYAYDAHTVKLELAGVGQQPKTVVKDRDTVIDIVDEYRLYDDQGADLSKTHKFGFPIRYGSDGSSYGYYGAWQGRQQIWTNGQPLPAGTVVTRADRPPNVTAETYTASDVFTGILVKRKYTTASLDDIKDVVVNAWDNESYMLQGDGAAWHRCQPMQQGQPPGPPVCDAAAFTDFATLVSNPPANVMLNGIVPQNGGGGGMAPMLALNGAHNGFVFQGTSTAFPPANGSWVNVNVGGPIWIVWDGTAWMKKEVLSVDQLMQPTFGPTSTPYTIPTGREFYLNIMGVNYVVRCASGTCSVQLETQLVANPANVATFVPASTTFTGPNCGGTGPSTFQFVTDRASPKFMKLVYATVGQDCSMGGGATQAQPGDVVKTGLWGLTATISGVDTQFNWDYPDQNNNCSSCGIQQFLLDGQGNLVLLDDPIRLATMDLVNGAGEHHSYAMSFDGSWLSGLPDLHSDLQQSHGELTDAIQAKNVNIAAGTVVADASDATKQYVFKPLRISQYLKTVWSSTSGAPDPSALDLSSAKALDLSTVPAWVPNGVGDMPTDFTVKYSDGKPIE